MSQMSVTPFSSAASISAHERRASGGSRPHHHPHVTTGEPISLNVGGIVYTTSLTTLLKYPESMLGRMFGGPIPTAQDGGGSFFIDRDGKLFRYILNFLRNDKLTLPENFAELVQLREEVDFYQIEPMLKALTEYETTRDRLRERAEEERRAAESSLIDGQLVDIVEHNVLDSSSGKTLQLYAPASILRCFPLQHEDMASVEKLVAEAQQTDYHPNRSPEGPLWHLGKGYIEMQNINYLTRPELGELLRTFGCKLLQSSISYSNGSEVTNKNVTTILDKWFVPDSALPAMREQSMARRALPPGNLVGFIDWNP